MELVVQQIQNLEWDENTRKAEEFLHVLAAIDGDIVQSTTAVHKQLLTSSGMRSMTPEDAKTVAALILKGALYTCKEISIARGQEFAVERVLCCLEKMFESNQSNAQPRKKREAPITSGFRSSRSALESFQLGSAEVPRIFMGLWQFSSPAWGTASKSKVDRRLRKHVDAGLVAYDMADHYGDAEVTFVGKAATAVRLT